MGWPFLWPADEPWPVCLERGSDEDARKYEALVEAMPEARERFMKVGAEALGLKLPDFFAHVGVSHDDLSQRQQQYRETMLQTIEQTRSGHRAPYLPVLQLHRDQFPDLPFPGDSDIFQLLWCPMVHFGVGIGKEGPGHRLYWRRAAPSRKSWKVRLLPWTARRSRRAHSTRRGFATIPNGLKLRLLRLTKSFLGRMTPHTKTESLEPHRDQTVWLP